MSWNSKGQPLVFPVDIAVVFKHVQRYHLQRQIATSLYGIIYKGWDQVTQQVVAIKITSLANKFKQQERVRYDAISDDPFREAETMRHIQQKFGSHPHVLQLVDEFVYHHASQSISRKAWDTNGDIHCLVTEFASGGDLFELVAKQALPLHQAKHIIKQILSAVQFLHETCQIAHLDISLENIMITCKRTMTVKLADFGVAVPFYQINPAKHTIVMSKRGYRAPELVQGYGVVPSACDIFSLGVLIWSILFQHAPFTGAEPDDRYYQQVQAQNYSYLLNRIATPSEEVLEVFRGLLAHEHAVRPTIDKVLEFPFFQS